MPLHRQSRAFLGLLRRAGAKSLSGLSPQEAREMEKRLSRLYLLSREPIKDVREIEIPGPAGAIPARAYLPEKESGGLPTLAYFHGGGWVLGDLDEYDPICRLIAKRTRSLVV